MDWINPVQHTEQVIKQGRAFFDSWLEQFSTWDDFVQALLYGSLPEFGPSAETAIKQVTEWLGGAAEAPHGHTYIVKYGVGEAILHRFTGIPTSTGGDCRRCCRKAVVRHRTMALPGAKKNIPRPRKPSSLAERVLSDYDMLCCMIDESNTQQQITPKIVFENVIAALAPGRHTLLIWH